MKYERNIEILNIRRWSKILCGCIRCGCRHLLQLKLVNLSLEVSNLIVSFHELNLMLLQLLLMLLQLILQILNLLGLSCLEICELTSLHGGGLLCLTQEATVPK
jgi:hypothetical protein